MSQHEDADTKAKRYDQWFREQVQATLKRVEEGCVVLTPSDQVRERLKALAARRKLARKRD
jgi:hypothetical protein